MKAIELDLMKEYRYLSNLYSAKGGLYYTETIADIETTTMYSICIVLNRKERKIPLSTDRRSVSHLLC